NMVTVQRHTRCPHQKQRPQVMATRQPVAVELNVALHINIYRAAADIIFYDTERIDADTVGQHHPADFALPDIQELPIRIGKQAQPMEGITVHPDMVPLPYQLKSSVSYIPVNGNIAATFNIEGRPVVAESAVTAQGDPRHA